jgi:trehalose/maltose hydrolase-like predicted phosphorylase
LSLQTAGLSLDPKLPAAWRSLAFAVQWRGRSLKIKIDQDKQCLEATLEDGEPMTLTIRGKPNELRQGQTLQVSFGKQVAAAKKDKSEGSSWERK